MDLIHLGAYAIGILLCMGFVCWLITLIPLPAPFSQLIIGVAIFVSVLLILHLFFPSFFGGLRPR